METNPSIDLNKINELVLSCPHVNNIHHVHVWQYSDNVTMLDAHINVDKNLESPACCPFSVKWSLISGQSFSAKSLNWSVAFFKKE